MRRCFGCNRKLPEDCGRELEDYEGIMLWVCYECMPKEPNEA